MKYRLLIITCGMIVILLAAMEINYQWSAQETFSKATIKYGAQGSDVKELQGRLKHIGFYNGKVDGDFGSNTLKSLKWFQGDFGLKPDGVAGPQTKVKLWKATKAWKPTAEDSGKNTTKSGASGQADTPVASVSGLSANDTKLMANAVYGEARGESHEGQIAVAAVILNRIKSPLFPNTISGVIFQPGAFTAVADGQIYLEPNENARKAVKEAMNGSDPSDGCLYYFNPDTATSKWIWSRPQYKKIGKHIFCR